MAKNNNKLIITQAKVIELLFCCDEYTPVGTITDNDILIAQERYLVPVIGEVLFAKILSGGYDSLCDDLLYPALAEYVRHVVLKRQNKATDISRCRVLMRELSDHLEACTDDYPDYDPNCNILNHCRINGAHIQIH